MKFTLGIKQRMTQLFDENGTVHPVTVLSAGKLTVVQVKTKAKEGYDAIQVAFGQKKPKNINKALTGHLRGTTARYLREFRIDNPSAYEVGSAIDLSAFAVGDTIEVTATSKGKGFQSVIKRHGFKGQPRSHGQKHSENAPGSIGGGLRNKVPKNMRMAGRTGGDRVTVKNLKVLGVDAEHGEILVSGAVPGRKGTLVEVRG